MLLSIFIKSISHDVLNNAYGVLNNFWYFIQADMMMIILNAVSGESGHYLFVWVYCNSLVINFLD